MCKERLNVDEIGYQMPDFGFNYNFSFVLEDEKLQGAGWRKFMDCVSIFPKYERVKNYIDFVN